MTRSRGVRGMAMALLLVGLTSSAASAAERGSGVREKPAAQTQALSAASVWLGDLLTSWRLGSNASSSRRTVAAELKQHVDNPGQTPMKDDGPH